MCSEGEFEQIAQACVAVHKVAIDVAKIYCDETRASVHFSIANFTEMLSEFGEIVNHRHQWLNDRADAISSCIIRLNKVEAEIRRLQEKLIALYKAENEAQSKARELKEMLREDHDIINHYAEEMKRLEELLIGKEAEIKHLQDAMSLSERTVEPNLSRARKRLIKNVSKREQLNLASQSVPHPSVRLVMEAVCILKDITPRYIVQGGRRKGQNYWPEAQILLQDGKFVRNLVSVDADNPIPDNILDKLTPYVLNEQFVPKKVGKSRRVLKHLCAFVIAIYEYYRAVREMRPKKEQIRIIEIERDGLQAELQVCNDHHKEVSTKIASMDNDLANAVATQKECEDKRVQHTETVKRGRKLCSILEDDKRLWEKELKVKVRWWCVCAPCSR